MSVSRLVRFTKYFTFLLAASVLIFAVSATDATARNSPPTAHVSPTKKGRLPVILIPGLIGSELINQKTGEKVWFSLSRARDDDIRLPISSDLKGNQDDLKPGDILRGIKLIRFAPEIEIYKTLIEELKKDGYTEGRLDEAGADGFADTFYVFPYDWRRDNVENAQLLLEKLDAVRTRTTHPELKFNIIAHSMGGLITRYAAMFGKQDLSASKMRPDPKGAAYFNSISLVATPNGGSLKAFNSLLNGFSFFGDARLNLPFVQNLSKFDLFTIPAIYQLMPHEGEARLFDENLKPLKLDIYAPETWEKYGWTAYADREFAKEFSAADQNRARAYFRAVLLRAKLFQAALRAGKAPVPTYYLGSECRDTPDGMIIYQDSKNGSWKTQIDIDSFTKSDGTKILRNELKPILRSPGDGIVTKRSLTASMPADSELTIVCGEHNRLTGEEKITKSLLKTLDMF